MQDNLKDHIESNPEDFDLYPFDTSKGWNEISKRVSPQKKKTKAWFIGVAASLAVLCISLVLVLTNSSSTQPNELAEIEGFYQEEINQKISLVRNQLGDDKILQDLEAMDAAFTELKVDLSENVDNEEVIVAMMENYRLKLQILEEILTELEKENAESTL